MGIETVVMSEPGRTHVQFVAVGQDDPLAAPLLDELADEYSSRYGSTRDAVMTWLLSQPAEVFAPPTGGMFVGLLAGEPVTGGAFQRFDDDTAELKRIWTHSAYRKRGLAKALLTHLEDQIAARGYRKVYLTTGHLQPEAEALYAAAGYTRLPEPLPADGTVFPVAFHKVLPAEESA
ncbi:GNAT family N-acetyltransferase [Mycolicibacterium smegmatis]|uniref:Acetyltransferase n=2 Tax=Mycolicibacterium smegmatis (strain ATCC 700084 / mc(2)155) TaxID=246196 RepID=A0QQJ1_MYCS2|nr:GNAT family N-acetyltransferase [Mycolicibacterium smegmatis]ABK76194.1 acetyltransferase [Mycolicibacterium smegmatis MC2 155]MDF1905848.1 GNAT family N-acetyltransferase [Mycolicibacterium smegmatis]MDF1920780.1 GNAT family N-acetyltransferase [Mycolicibacterium smegmatis]MDF1926796.1 GNAT family N-acetyltransferase [Mycolicibacterium smegmatis]TBH29137.1 GNAT family N-acetyltransferase [Mycolicibacterium smegmatis MC2 155]